MAADILLYDANLVPVGEDQKQHIELTRNLAERMNNQLGEDTFVVPEPYIAKVAARVMDLLEPTNKMSKSAVNPAGCVFFSDSAKQIEKKFKRAMTDSDSIIAYDVKEKPGVSNLLGIQSAITGKSIEDIVASYEGKMYGNLKVDTAEIVNAELSPIKEKIDELMSDETELRRILDKGADKARAKASVTLKRVYDRIGF
jgi:tryptophanyl-tRNA synthetase